MNSERYSRLFKIFALASAATAHVSSLDAEEENQVYELDPVYVTAPRFLTGADAVAARVETISSETIRASGASNLVELLTEAGNLQFRTTSGNAGGAQVAMRGFGENSGQRVLVLVDGHRLNTADLSQVDWLSIPLSLVESVEVIRGGQSALYGNNASAGVIKITTRRATEGLEGGISGQVGSFDSFNTRLGLSGSEGKLGFSVHAEHDETDGYRDNSWYEADGAGLMLDYRLAERSSAHFAISGVERDYGLPGAITEAQYEADPTQTNSPDDYGETESTYFRGGIAHCFIDNWTVALDAGYSEREIISTYAGPWGGTFSQEYDLWTLSPSLTYSDGGLTVVTGVDLFKDDIDSFGQQLERDRESLYTSLEYRLSPKWTMTAALRGESSESVKGADSETDDEYGWSLGLVRHFETARVYGNIQRIYRFPATDEMAAVFPLPGFNPDLEAESGMQYEIGWEKHAGAMDFGAFVYLQESSREVMLDPTAGGFGANINADDTQRVGFEFSLGVDFAESLRADLSYEWVQAEFDEGVNSGEVIPVVSEHKTSLSFGYQPSEDWYLGVRADYLSAYQPAGDFSGIAGELNGRFLVGLSARWALQENLELFADVDNLFDQQYVSFATSNGVGATTAYYPGSGRSGSLGLRWRF